MTVPLEKGEAEEFECTGSKPVETQRWTHKVVAAGKMGVSIDRYIHVDRLKRFYTFKKSNWPSLPFVYDNA